MDAPLNCVFNSTINASKGSSIDRSGTGFGVGHMEEGYFNDTMLNDLNWILIAKFPGEIAEGNGRMRANPSGRLI